MKSETENLNDRQREQLRRRDQGELYDVYQTGDPSWLRARMLIGELRCCRTPEEARDRLETLLEAYPKSSVIVPPFTCDLGSRIRIGEHCHINMDCLFLDEGRITIGDHVLIGPRCSFYTPVHPLDAQIRRTGLETARPISIESDVWLGGSVVVNPGVTIGAGSVIGSGSVVTRSVPAGVFAAGNPCRVIRRLDEKDREIWHQRFEDYRRSLARFSQPASSGSQEKN